MSKKDNVAAVPKYRFPEFLNCLNWKKEELNKLGKVISGLTYSPQDIREKGLLVLRSSNIKDNIIDLKDTVYVRSDVKGYTLTEEKDILICVRNGSKSLIGKNALVPKGMPLCTNGAFMIVFRANNPCFVFQLFQSEQFNKQVKADLGATINSINSKQLKKYIFTIPQERKEQQKIADCLSSIDDLISAEEKKLALLNNYKKGWMQKLFPAEGKTVPEWRFPEFRDSGEWKENRMEDIVICNNSTMSLNKLEIKIKGYPVYGADGVVGYIDTYQQNDKYISMVKDGSGVGRLNLNTGYSSILGTLSCLQLKNKTKYILEWVYYYLNSMDFSVYVKGSGIPHIYYSDYKNRICTTPDCLEQQKIADFLSGIDELIIRQTDKIEALKQHRQSLMQGLFPATEEVW